MPVNLQQAIQEQVHALSENEMQQVLNFVQKLRKVNKVHGPSQFQLSSTI